MGKALHKPKPSVPRFYWLDTDGCWQCPSNQRDKACGNCRHLHHFNHRKDKVNRHKIKQQLHQERR